jgi:ribosomal-protein-alanine N-acetyltransferase
MSEPGMNESGTNVDRVVVVETPRLQLGQLTFDHAPFIFELVNEPGWLRFIGDKGVRNLDDARGYLRTGPMASYQRFGFGLYAVSLKEDGTLLGMCGLLKRDTLPDVDIGFAFLQRHQGRGYAHEAAAGMIAHARERLGLKRILAITTIDNDSSANVLGKIGMRFHSMVPSNGEADLRLFELT